MFRLLFLLVTLYLASCSGENSAYIIGSNAQKQELRSLFRVLNEKAPTHEDRYDLTHFAAARKIAALLLASGNNALAASFLVGLSQSSDTYASWYIYTAAAAYEAQGELELAVRLYERLIRILPDMEIEGKSIHYEALKRLARNVDAPERRIQYYLDMLARFPSAPDTGVSYFLLAKEYERIGSWKEALANYAAFLPYFGVDVPGYPDALAYARRLVEFNASPKDWSSDSLEELVSAIRTALSAGSARQLRKYASKAGFFAVSWYQDSGMDANSKVAFDLNQFMRGHPIQSSPSLHPLSGPFEAYLRTWGWTGRIPVWYLYFRKIDFPADPGVHGQWEWAGIYFGERMQ